VSEKEMLDTLTKDASPVIFDEEQIPEQERWLGSAIEVGPLGLLVITILGTGGALVFKSLLQSVASELGKKLVEHFFRKAKKEQNPLVVLYEISPTAVAEVHLVSPAHPGFQQMKSIPALIEGKTRQLTADTPNHFLVAYDERSKIWKAEEVQSLGAVIYRGEVAIKRI
jgi:hypothetical protein